MSPKPINVDVYRTHKAAEELLRAVTALAANPDAIAHVGDRDRLVEAFAITASSVSVLMRLELATAGISLSPDDAAHRAAMIEADAVAEQEQRDHAQEEWIQERDRRLGGG